MPHPVSPLPKASSVVPALYFSTLRYCARVINISFYSITACYCFLCETVVVPHKDKQKKNKLAIDTWSIGGTAVTAKLSKTKLKSGQGKSGQSRPDKPQSWGLVNSVQSLQPAMSNGNAIWQGYMVLLIIDELCWRYRDLISPLGRDCIASTTVISIIKKLFSLLLHLEFMQFV